MRLSAVAQDFDHILAAQYRFMYVAALLCASRRLHLVGLDHIASISST